jgi:hypothetical protein
MTGDESRSELSEGTSFHGTVPVLAPPKLSSVIVDDSHSNGFIARYRNLLCLRLSPYTMLTQTTMSAPESAGDLEMSTLADGGLRELPFPPVTKDHILNCSYHSWHPK